MYSKAFDRQVSGNRLAAVIGVSPTTRRRRIPASGRSTSSADPIAATRLTSPRSVAPGEDGLRKEDLHATQLQQRRLLNTDQGGTACSHRRSDSTLAPRIQTIRSPAFPRVSASGAMAEMLLATPRADSRPIIVDGGSFACYPVFFPYSCSCLLIPVVSIRSRWANWHILRIIL